jgi:hypothetical protein
MGCRGQIEDTRALLQDDRVGDLVFIIVFIID